ncbi:hypothetical protein JCM15831A_09990 [Asaia astilbis]
MSGFAAECLKIRHARAICCKNAQARTCRQPSEAAMRAQDGQGAGEPAHVEKGFW